MTERDCCQNESNWTYDSGNGCVWCNVCGKVVFDGPDADMWGHNEYQGEDNEN